MVRPASGRIERFAGVPRWNRSPEVGLGILFPEEDAVEHLERVEVPTTVVVGGHDPPEIGVIARRLAEGIPGARLEIVAGADHYLPLRAPDGSRKSFSVSDRVNQRWYINY